MTRIIPIASGKGGVGKTVISTNLAVQLAAMGKTVILVDLDLGGANLHTCLGVKNTNRGIGSMAWGQEKSLEGLLMETGIDRLYFIPGDELLPGTANIEFFAKKRVLKGLSTLVADYVVCDLGAGSAHNVVDFFLASRSGIIVTQPEITAVLNAYSFLKSALYRALARAFPKAGPERDAVKAYGGTRVEGGDRNFRDFAAGLCAGSGKKGEEALALVESLRPRVIVNMGGGPKDAELGNKLREIVGKNLGVALDFAGYVMRDPAVPRSVAERRPAALVAPDSPFARTMALVARRIASEPAEGPLVLYDGDDAGLGAVMEEGLAAQTVAE